MTKTTIKYNRFEKARIIGARALQISLGAPVLVKIATDLIDPVKIAELEFEKDVIPITVKRTDIDYWGDLGGSKNKRR
jgi:DNA-directed RNA polymerase subunit K